MSDKQDSHVVGDEELGRAIAKVVRDAIGGLNHTHIGYSSEHDYLADPYIDDIMALVKSHTQQIALEAQVNFIESTLRVYKEAQPNSLGIVIKDLKRQLATLQGQKGKE